MDDFNQEIVDDKLTQAELKDELKDAINKLNKTLDRMQWLIISTIIVVLLKDEIINLVTSFIK